MNKEQDDDVEFSDLVEKEVMPGESDYTYAMRPQYGRFLKENKWSDELWNLFVRYNASDIRFFNLTEEDLLRNATYLNFKDELTLRRLKIGAEWEPTIPSDDTVIRRYLTFDRFVDLIDNGGFWMSNIFEFPDQFEASFPEPSVNARQQFVDAASDLSQSKDQLTYGIKKQRERDVHTYVNCWRVGEEESSVFWDAYIGDEDGLAIQTTIGDLRDHINNKTWGGYIDILISEGHTAAMREFSKVLIGEVEYLDYDSEPISHSLLSPARFFHKRHAFRDEQEFRLVRTPIPLTSTEDLPEPRDNLILDANLKKLIDKVVLAPDSSDKFRNIAKRSIENFLGIPVEKSPLSQDPDSVNLPNY